MFNPCEKKCTLFHCKCSSILLNYTFFPQKSVNKIDFHFLLYNINYTLNVVRKKVLNSASIILNINKVKLLTGNHNRIFFFFIQIFLRYSEMKFTYFRKLITHWLVKGGMSMTSTSVTNKRMQK